nr:hypothetical protein [Streptomyces sp. TLI_235]
MTTVADPATTAALRALLRSTYPGDRLLAHRSGRGWHEVRADDLNSYLRERSGTDLTAEDFRTWDATVLAAVGLAVSVRTAAGSEAARRRAVARVVREVADRLGNTPAVCHASYINPGLVELFEDGVTIAPDLDGLAADDAPPAVHGPVEEAVRTLLLTDGGR